MNQSPEIQRAAAQARATLGSGRQTAYEFVHGVLRWAIVTSQVRPGSRLVQEKLASALDVSTTPIREALRDLASEGLIAFDPHRGAVVQELTEEGLQEIYMIRRLLEPVALRLAVPEMTPELVEILHVMHERIAVKTDKDEWLDADRDFHLAMYEAAGLDRLSTIIEGLEDASIMYVGASLIDMERLRETAVSEHGAILEALADRDEETAVGALLTHLETAVGNFEARATAVQDA